MRIARLGDGLFAATMIGLGILGIVTGTFPPIWSGVAPTFPGREAIIDLSAAIALICGVGLLFTRTALIAARVLLVYFALWFLVFRIPLIVKTPASSGAWWACGATAVLASAAWLLSKRFVGERNTRYAQMLYALGLIPFGVAHYTFLERTVAMVPSYLPWHTAFAYLTGAAFIAVGIAILTGVYARIAATFMVIQLALFTLLVWVPIILAHPGPSDWSEFIESITLLAAAWVVADSYLGLRWLAVRHARLATQAPDAAPS
ncbi:MAG TPA: hypothetical protein VGM50_22695 [Gemmatimonadaceae bacterium]|jgi:uncharacterized membrane protein